jgi:hypothetical protein
MLSARDRALRVYRSQTHRYYRGKEGKWSEKIITFTVPHSEHGPAHDARVLVDAWQKMLRRVRAHLVQRGCVERTTDGKAKARSVPWNRALEVSVRSEHHAHMHVWWLGPYLESALLQVWWGQILSEAGAPVERLSWGDFLAGARQSGHAPDSRLAEWLGNPLPADVLPWGIVDVRANRSDSASLSQYTQKVGVALYVTKGVETARLEPSHAAAIYEVFEGVRAVQWARGWAPQKTPMRALCVSFRRLSEDEKKKLNGDAKLPRKDTKQDGKTQQKEEIVLAQGAGGANRAPDTPAVARPAREQMAFVGI